MTHRWQLRKSFPFPYFIVTYLENVYFESRKKKRVYSLRCEPDKGFFLLSGVLLRLAVWTLVATSSCSRAKKADDDFGTFSLLSLICFNTCNRFIMQLLFPFLAQLVENQRNQLIMKVETYNRHGAFLFGLLQTVEDTGT